ncbi:MAG: tetratricopeptide repeat protein, partial [Chitinophagaceae bacterium]
SDSLWAKSLFENGVTFQTELRNIPAAINCYEQFLAKFIQSSLSANVLYNLVYCYQQTGQPEKANLKIDILREGFGSSSFTKSIVQNAAPQKPEKQIEAVYSEIFSLFQQNKWEQSIRLKDSLENIVGKNHRTPAIQYLDCIQLARSKQDSLAKDALVNFLKNHPTDPLAEKAQIMLEVLRERDAIELHLTYSTEEKIIDDTITERRIILEETQLQVKERNKPTVGNISATTVKPIINQPVALPPPAINNSPLAKAKEFVFDAKDKYWVGLIFKPDDASLNEVRNAFNRYNKQIFYDRVPALNDINLNSASKLLLYGTFDDAAAAIKYFDKIKLQASYSIIPWIQPTRYQFILISNQNLDLLKENKQLENYLNYIKKIFPDKF